MRILILLLVSLFLVSCLSKKNEPTPSDVINSYITAGLSGDREKLKEMILTKDKKQIEELNSIVEQYKPQLSPDEYKYAKEAIDLEKQIIDSFKDIQGTKFEVVKIEPKGDTTFVTVNFMKGDQKLDVKPFPLVKENGLYKISIMPPDPESLRKGLNDRLNNK